MLLTISQSLAAYTKSYKNKACRHKEIEQNIEETRALLCCFNISYFLSPSHGLRQEGMSLYLARTFGPQRASGQQAAISD